MEIGVISDTHGLVRPEVYNVFEGVDLILHAGDIGGRDVIIELEVLAPVRAVAGNIDMDLAGRFPESVTFNIQQWTFRMQHQCDDLPETASSPSSRVQTIIVFGHSHQPVNRQVKDILYFNPGSAGPRRFKLPVCVGRLKLTQENIEGRIIHLI